MLPSSLYLSIVLYDRAKMYDFELNFITMYSSVKSLGLRSPGGKDV
jgi:hypothetical protein